ncbi:MAG: biopolymer transporter ExbD [Alphaproteobacteria bacterium]|nr:biopolymer transporter ExbD [Alphaproteobacteria bacterium]MCB9930387.1 biopolymer transporter ExbD [Alphaproteobacteria bacterium]
MTAPLFRPKRRRGGLADDRILPLINVVFLLLIFFMLAGRLAASDPFPVAPPASSSEAADDGGETVIHLAADGALALNGRPVALEDLQALVPSAAPLRLKADAGVEALRVVGVLAQLRAAGVRQVSLVTRAGAGALR